MELRRSELTVRRERALLVCVQLRGDTRDEQDPLNELHGLATTAGAVVVGTLRQKRQRPDAGSYLGHGKVEQLAQLAQHTQADVIIFDNELTPAQIRNLELATDTKVLDRTEVILDIFASRARTHEARLQVELAQLEYALPRLKRMWPHLSRMEGGIGMRGPGEQQLEEDRRIVDRRITELRGKLRLIQARKEREVASRSSERTVAIVGYTNAGKSTLMNVLTDAGVLVEDKLFATLDTRTRQWHIPGFGRVLLSDTVGFIRDLPHHLVASFKATLEEVRRADLLLHVVDASIEASREQIHAVKTVLESMGCRDKPTLLVLNKTDAVRDQSYLAVLRALDPNSVSISARANMGLEHLQRAVAEALAREYVHATVETSAGNGKLLAYLDAHAIPLSRVYDDGRVMWECRLPRQCIGHVSRLRGTVRLCGITQDGRSGTGSVPAPSGPAGSGAMLPC
jgi:GTP-binding protein HflX